MQSIPELMTMLREGTKHLRSMAQKLEYPWKPDESDPRVLHNNYARNLVTAYVSKFSNLSDGLLDAIEKENYLVYALNGRAMIENVATLRYYVQHEDLGKFRQVYQRLRESIRDNQPIEWDWSEHDEYTAFKNLAPRVAHLIRTGRNTRGKIPEERAGAWLAVTSNKFEDFWREQDRAQPGAPADARKSAARL